MIAVIGEVLVDLVIRQNWSCQAFPGGGPANVAVALARLGQPVSLRARVSRDGFGRMLREHLAANGVSLRDVISAAEPTTLAIATLDGDGQASYSFRRDGTADWMWRDAELPPLPAEVDALYFGSLAAALPPGAALVENLARQARSGDRMVIVYDPNLRPAVLPDRDAERTRVERQLALAHVAKASSEDIGFLYPGLSVADVARRWIGLGPDLVMLTLGTEGAFAVSKKGREARVPTLPVVVRDTIGAGDAFTAGLLAAMAEDGLLGSSGAAGLRDLDSARMRQLLARATLVASITCERAGADPPTSAEVAARSRGEPPSCL